MDQVTTSSIFRDQLLDRRQRLEVRIARGGDAAGLRRLLDEVDAALARVHDGSYGLCETCHDPIEPERLIADPLIRFCLDHLTFDEQRALEQDLALAARIQRALLPPADVQVNGWQVAHHFEPAGIVSGDYCDHQTTDEGSTYFMLGDVAGKGIAASMLMAHLHALLRALIPLGLPLEALMARASRVFCESTLPTHYATLVCGRAARGGHVEVCNAGHPPPLLVQQGGVTPVEATGLPVGLFSSGQYTVSRLVLAPGDTLVLCTDGVLEAENPIGEAYGPDRLSSVVGAAHTLQPRAIIEACVRDLATFREGVKQGDDVTLMALHRCA